MSIIVGDLETLWNAYHPAHTHVRKLFFFLLVFIICYESSSAWLICDQSSLCFVCCHIIARKHKVVVSRQVQKVCVACGYFYFATSGCFLYLTLECFEMLHHSFSFRSTFGTLPSHECLISTWHVFAHHFFASFLPSATSCVIALN